MRNTGSRPAVMTNVGLAGAVRYVADDAFFWLEPGQQRSVTLRLRSAPEGGQGRMTVVASAWNAPPVELAGATRAGDKM